MSRDAVHIHLGFAALVLTVLVTKRSLSSWRILIPGFLLSVVMEILDASDDLSKSKLYPLEYVHDLVNTNFIPAAIVLLCYLGAIKTNSKKDFPSEKP